MRKLYNISNKANIIQSETGEIKAIEVENTKFHKFQCFQLIARIEQ